MAYGLHPQCSRKTSAEKHRTCVLNQSPICAFGDSILLQRIVHGKFVSDAAFGKIVVCFRW